MADSKKPRQTLRVRFPLIAVTVSLEDVDVDIFDGSPSRLAATMRLSSVNAAVLSAALQAAVTQAQAYEQQRRERKTA